MKYMLIVGLSAVVSCASTRSEKFENSGEAASSRPDHFHRRFDDPQKWASVFDDPERDAWQKPSEVIDALDVEPGMTAADVGAGTGYFAPHLARAVGPNGEVLAVDIEPSMVEYMRERFEKEGLDNARAVLGREDGPGLDPSSVDRMIIVNTWHHIPRRDAYGRRLHDVMAPGGRVLIVDFTPDSAMGPPKHHRIPAETVAETLAEVGFETEILSEGLPRQFIVAAVKPAR